jgi:outer membrane receptor for ferrienterochelin and colicin
MRRTVVRVAAALLLQAAPAARAHDIQDFEFFAAEAEVVSASRQPRLLSLAPATVHVLTAADLRASGAQTLWDALRAVPGVDVVSARAFQGEVGIRGLNRALNNRTLVLLDKRTILKGFGDFVTWESIPVSLEEIDRIEIVEGAVSAQHGANAINGVIHIITKRPEDLPRGLVCWAGGQRGTHLGTAIVAEHGRRTAGKLSVGWRATNQFAVPDQRASDVVTLHSMLRFQPVAGLEVIAGGGFANLNTQVTTGVPGTAFDDGGAGFARLELRRAATSLRTFWNRGRSTYRDLALLQEPVLKHDTWDATLEHSLGLPGRQRLVLGGSYRRNTMDSPAFAPQHVGQDLVSAFLEHSWDATASVGFVASTRWDRHPLAGWVFSPRGAAILRLGTRQSVRLSAGSSFRNPTLMENYLQVSQDYPNPGGTLPNPPYATLRFQGVGNRDLVAERLALYEIAYHAQVGRLRATFAAFDYHLHHQIEPSETSDASRPPVYTIVDSYSNENHVEAMGGEGHVETTFRGGLRGFVNYSYQDIEDASGFPRHKANCGLRYLRRGFTANLWIHWVDRTLWATRVDAGAPRAEVPAYFLVNGHVEHELWGPLRDFAIGVSAFNLTNEKQAQILPAQPGGEPGQNGEPLAARWLVGITYRMH